MKNTLNQPLWTKNFIVVSSINFLIVLMFYLLMVVIGPYAVAQFGASTSTAGLVSSIFIIGSLLGRFITGRFITGWGNRKAFIVGLTFFTLTTVAYFFAHNLAMLIINRLLQGIAAGIVTTATGTVIAQIIPANRRGEGIGYFSMSGIVATAIGPFVGILLTQLSDDFRVIFIVNTILVAVCFGIFFLTEIPNTTAPKAPETAKKSFSYSNYFEPKALPISLIALMIGFAYSGIMSFLTFYSKEIDLVQAGSLFFLVYSIAVLLSRPFTGKLVDIRGANVVMYPAFILFAIGIALFSQAAASFAFLFAAVLMGLGYGNFLSVAQALAIKATDPHRFGLATSTYFMLLDLGLGLGPYLLGALVPIIGYRQLFLFMTPVIVVSLILYAILLGRKEKAQRRALHQ